MNHTKQIKMNDELNNKQKYANCSSANAIQTDKKC